MLTRRAALLTAVVLFSTESEPVRADDCELEPFGENLECGAGDLFDDTAREVREGYRDCTAQEVCGKRRDWSGCSSAVWSISARSGDAWSWDPRAAGRGRVRTGDPESRRRHGQEISGFSGQRLSSGVPEGWHGAGEGDE